MVQSLKQNWKIYSMEAVCLGLFMMSASLFATLLEYPGSSVHQALPNGNIRSILMGLAMGLSAILIIYSPMGKLSGAHMNPAFTFTFWRLRKVKTPDLVFYCAFQCIGGIVSVCIMRHLLGESFEDPHVNYVVTVPGKFGVAAAFVTEVIIAFMMMMMVLTTSNHLTLSKYTGLIAGFFVMSYAIITGPISGFGMNPARTLASAIPAMQFSSLWIYMVSPFMGMLSAAALYQRFKGAAICAKLHHSEFYSCIFNCGYCKHQEVGSSNNE
jgi:aquaporin Z